MAGEVVVFEDFVDFLPLVPDTGIGLLKVAAEISRTFLNGEMVVSDRAEEKGADFVVGAKFEEVTGVGQGANGGLDFAESGVKPGFQLRHRDIGSVFVVEDGEREAKLGAELFQCEFGALCLREDVICGFPDGGEVIHQSAGPIKDDIANHVLMLAETICRAKRISQVIWVPRQVTLWAWLSGNETVLGETIFLFRV